MKRATFLLLATLVLAAPATRAADLAEHLPPDTIASISWGPGLMSDELAAYADAAERFVRQSNDLDDEERRIFRRLIRTGRTLLSRDGTIAITGLYLSDYGGDPVPEVVLLVDAGDDAGSLTRNVRSLLRSTDEFAFDTLTIDGVEYDCATPDAGEAPVHLIWREVDGRVMLALTGDPEGLVAGIGNPERSLAANARYRQCRDATATDRPIHLSLFIDVPAIIDLIEEIAEHEDEPLPLEFDDWIEQLGVAAMQGIYFQLGGSGPDSVTDLYIGTSGPQHGLLKLWDQQPLRRSDLAVIPANAYWGSACNFDLLKLWEEMRRVAVTLNPDAEQDIEEGLAEAREELGFHVIDELLASLGDTWVLYDAPEQGSLIVTGAVLVVDVRDDTTLRRCFKHLIERISSEIDWQGAELRIMKTQRDGHTIRYVVAAGLPSPIAPAAAFVGDRVVCGLTPQAVMTALTRFGPAGQASSVLTLPATERLLAEIPLDRLQSFNYVDNEVFARFFYGLMLPYQTMFVSMAASDDFHAGTVPSLAEVLQNVHPAVSGCTADEDGVRYHGQGSTNSLTLMSAATTTLGLSVLLPALFTARAEAARVMTGSNLHQIGIACHIYRIEQGEWPPDLESLFSEGYLSDRTVLHSPRHPEGEVAYELVTGHEEDAYDPARLVLVYEIPVDRRGTNVLFLDGHVEWMSMGQFEQALHETYEQLGRADEVPAF